MDLQLQSGRIGIRVFRDVFQFPGVHKILLYHFQQLIETLGRLVISDLNAGDILWLVLSGLLSEGAHLSLGLDANILELLHEIRLQEVLQGGGDGLLLGVERNACQDGKKDGCDSSFHDVAHCGL